MYGKMRFRSEYKLIKLEELECLRTEYDSMYDYITQGTIIRSRATWYEFGERNNKYFLNLENSERKKSTVRKVFNREVRGVARIFSEVRTIPQIN